MDPQPRWLVPVVFGTLGVGLLGWWLTSWLTTHDYTPTGERGQQVSSCDGVPPPTDLVQLPREAEVAGIVVCRSAEVSLDATDPAGRRIETVELADPAGVAAVLQAEDDGPGPFGGTCDSLLVLVPDFVVTLADGSRLRPGAPDDGCRVRDEVLVALHGPGRILTVAPDTPRPSIGPRSIEEN